MRGQIVRAVCWLSILVGTAALIAACGGGGGASGNPDAQEVSNNTNDTNNTIDRNNTNNTNNTNSGQCTPEQCAQSGQICTAQGCVDPPPTGCRSAGDTCDPTQLDQQTFVCLPVDDMGSNGVCLSKCDPNAPVEESCPSGSVCFDFSEGTEQFGACLMSECSGIFASEECADAGPNGGTCMPGINNINFCVPAGTAQEGAACVDMDFEVPPEQLCAVGVLCIDEECMTPCNPADANSCEGGLQCTEVFTGRSDIGLCFAGCQPYTVGQCPGGQGCIPISTTEGVCQEVGGLSAGSTCGEPVQDSCGEGQICLLQDEETGTGTCELFCNPNATQGQPGACGGQGEECFELSLPHIGV